jgi:hypothetical protein
MSIKVRSATLPIGTSRPDLDGKTHEVIRSEGWSMRLGPILNWVNIRAGGRLPWRTMTRIGNGECCPSRVSRRLKCTAAKTRGGLSVRITTMGA